MRGEMSRGRLVVMTRHGNTIVHSACVGGAASASIDHSVRVAPLRDKSHVAAAERRAAHESSDPWDPWPARRLGYREPADADLSQPPRAVLDRLASYLVRVG